MDHISIIIGNVFSALYITVHEDGFSDLVVQLSMCPYIKAVSSQTIKIDS